MGKLIAIHGYLFGQNVDAIVNAVNCVGVMGAGVALEFKRRFPAMYTAYVEHCRNGALAPGIVDVEPVTIDGNPRFVVDVPTKWHWRDPSTAALVQRGLDALVDAAHCHGFTSIAMPALGCGLGGLSLQQVMPLMEDAARRMDATSLRLILRYR